MLVHILGWTVVVVQLCTAAAVLAWMWNPAHDGRTWRRPIRVPRLALLHPSTNAGPRGFSEFVGPI